MVTRHFLDNNIYEWFDLKLSSDRDIPVSPSSPLQLVLTDPRNQASPLIVFNFSVYCRLFTNRWPLARFYDLLFLQLSTIDWAGGTVG